MLDAATFGAIMDSNLSPGTVIASVLCPTSEEKIKITIKARQSGKCVTFGVGPDEPLADISRTVARMSDQLVDDSRHGRAIAKQASLLKS
jgi:hypothetical protein